MKNLTISFKNQTDEQIVEKWIDFLSGIFELTPMEVKIMNKLVYYLLGMIKEGITNENSKHLLYLKKDEIRNNLGLKIDAFNKHLRGLNKKEAIIVGENFILIHNYLIPKKSIKIEFNNE